jgi:hypothetical protein
MLRTPTKALHGHGRVEAEPAGYGAKLFLSFVLIATCTYSQAQGMTILYLVHAHVYYRQDRPRLWSHWWRNTPIFFNAQLVGLIGGMNLIQ